MTEDNESNSGGIFDDLLDDDETNNESTNVEKEENIGQISSNESKFSNLTYINFGTFKYHLRNHEEEETVCGISLNGSEFKEGSNKPKELLEPCKMCYGTSKEVTNQKSHYRTSIANKIDNIDKNGSKPEEFTSNELNTILKSIPTQFETYDDGVESLRYQLFRGVKNISSSEEKPEIFSLSELKSLNNAVDGVGVIPNSLDIIIVGNRGTIKRTPLSEFETQNRGGKGVNHIELNISEETSSIYTTHPRDFIYIITTSGMIHRIRGYEIPSRSKEQSGTSITEIGKLDSEDQIASIISSEEIDNHQYLISATNDGYIKRTRTDRFENIHSTGIRAAKTDKCKLVEAELSDSNSSILLSSGNGYLIRFLETDVRSMGRSAKGAVGIDLKNEDQLIDLSLHSQEESSFVFTLTEQGYGKRTIIDDYRVQKRNGKGLIDIKTNKRNGSVVQASIVNEEDDIIVVTEQGRAIRIPASNISCVGRNTQGVNIIDLNEDDLVASSTVVSHL